MLVHWAARNSGPIKGALLAAPPDLETPMPAGYPTLEALQAHGWLPVPRTRLPFPTLLGASRDDPLCAFACSAAFASDWGSRLVDLGKVGHLNPASGFGPWPQAETLIRELDEA
jgi:predicted alpha/beta hydrolase family esterase